MHRTIGLLCLLVILCWPGPGLATRIKDIADIAGVRDNQLVGYGLVVGLNGSGDGAGTRFTVQSLVNMMERMGLTIDRNAVKVSNVAAVMVTAQLPPFARTGNGLDVLVSSVGDAKSLVGGTLLMTPLKGADGLIYAVAQGPLMVGALSFGGKAAKVQTNHPTVGRIPGGALIERQLPPVLPDNGELVYRLRQADFSTVARMTRVINDRFGAGTAEPLDGGGVRIVIPEGYRDKVLFIADLEGLQLQPDARARIVLNERTGTIVMGKDVRISTIAVSHGNLSLMINESASVSQPNPLAQGDTVIVPETTIQVNEDQSELVVLQRGVSIGEVARALNAIGATPRDLIAIFQAIKAAGALHAELVVL
ncbi:MAG: flagellar basal body P-ring protein FlgI [Desulfobacterales bacterium]|nr:flagellar basal body P-ring protein FlgI [Desulfobacterales bacterium]